jgi:glycosyltransferase involved in cell wall biosynthesis
MASPGHLETFALQNRTSAVRDVFAAACTNGAHLFDDLMATLRDVASTPSADASAAFVRGLDPKFLLILARLVANQGTCIKDAQDAVMLFKLTLAHHNSKVFKREDKLILCEELARLGYATDLKKYSDLLRIGRLDRYQPDLLRANVTNPFAAGSTPSRDSVEKWLARVNVMYLKEGVEPIAIAPGSGVVFDRILCGAGSRIEHPVKVTVIVPTYMSGPRIDAALASVTAQSWQNLEILVMDDCSPAENDRHLEAWARRDDRVRIVKLEENAGTYVARNIAMSRYATGDLVTVHDDDDWSHPRKIETQVRHLLANPDELANVSLLSRATEDLKFTRINNNPVFLQPNYSSLMFWRERVTQELGYWDLVNRSADAEYFDRIAALTGRKIPVAGRSAMSFLRVREGSLTSGEIWRGYFDVRRAWYRHAYRKWHTERLASGESLFVGTDNRDARAFSAPVGMLGSKHTQDVCEVDVVYATDFRFPGGNSSLSSEEIDLLLKRGLRVGLMQIDSPLNGATAAIYDRILELSRHENCLVVSPLENVRAPLTLVRHPTVMQFVNGQRSGLETGKVVVIVNHSPAETGGQGSVYDMADVISNVKKMFGVEPIVAPESGIIREGLRGRVPSEILTSFEWRGIVGRRADAPRRLRPDRGAPVIGRHGRDHVLKWPDRDDLLSAYPIDGSVDIRVLGGAEVPLSLLAGEEVSWTVHEFGSMDPWEFLGGLDFWMYFHSERLLESFGMAAAEALASGLVAVLPPYMEKTFGEGAVYADPQDALAVVEKYWTDPVLYQQQSKRAIQFVDDHLSAQAFYSRIDRLSGRSIRPTAQANADRASGSAPSLTG